MSLCLFVSADVISFQKCCRGGGCSLWKGIVGFSEPDAAAVAAARVKCALTLLKFTKPSESWRGVWATRDWRVRDALLDAGAPDPYDYDHSCNLLTDHWHSDKTYNWVTNHWETRKYEYLETIARHLVSGRLRFPTSIVGYFSMGPLRPVHYALIEAAKQGYSGRVDAILRSTPLPDVLVHLTVVYSGLRRDPIGTW